MATRTLLALGGQHVHLTEIVERRGEGGEPGSVDTVVVGDEENGHSADQEVRILLPRSHLGFDRLRRVGTAGGFEAD